MGRIQKKGTWGIQDLVNEFKDKPYLIDMGAGKISKRYRIARDIVYEARRKFRSEVTNEQPDKMPKILVLDIETAPLLGYVWSLWKQNIYDEQLVSDWFMLTWSAKWLFGETVMSDRLTGDEATKQTDKRIVKGLRALLDEADIVVAHNGKRFDIRKINARMVYHDLKPVSPYQQIDTLLAARKEFGFSSNKLNSLGKMFGFGEKIGTSFELWSRCMSGDNSALREMEDYNKRDVDLLESVYLKMRPWIKSHPNIGLFVEADEPVCPVCGSTKLKWKGHYHTMTGKYKTFRCECGALGRQRTSDFDKDKRKQLIVSLAR